MKLALGDGGIIRGKLGSDFEFVRFAFPPLSVPRLSVVARALRACDYLCEDSFLGNGPRGGWGPRPQEFFFFLFFLWRRHVGWPWLCERLAAGIRPPHERDFLLFCVIGWSRVIFGGDRTVQTSTFFAGLATNFYRRGQIDFRVGST